MKEFEVPKLGVAANLRLQGGDSLDVTLFVPSAGPDGGPGRLIDRLNDASERFIPATIAAGHELINKDHIVWARPGEAQDGDDPNPAAGQSHRVRIALTDGESLEGTLHYVLRPERSRLLDYFNEAPPFIVLDGPRPTFVNRRFIVRLADLDDAE